MTKKDLMNKPIERLKIYLGFESTTGLLSASSFILLTAIISLLWSHAELLWSDEFGILMTDSVGSISRMLYVQRNYPICLDPAVYHLVAHGFIYWFGPCAMAIRIPSLIGYIVMQVCLFIFVRRGVNERAALFAIALSSMTGT
ncbi:putative membrane protein [Edaphobacter lichenicola]|uniref:Membrane protein n=1 Tax=Tunturiibacter lichenicola TaxID=2051959 RepID=A0A852VMV8_9BACT|nr:putative membrane protein [Edaphobacter lichenicola]